MAAPDRTGKLEEMLPELQRFKDYFVVTSNGEDPFVPAGFERDKVFEMEGRLTQSSCQNGCGAAVYENWDEILKMAEAEKDGCIPAELRRTGDGHTVGDSVCDFCGYTIPEDTALEFYLEQLKNQKK